MGLFLKVLMFTIKMATQKTMTSVTWKLCQELTILRNMQMIWRDGTIHKSASTTLQASGQKLHSGMGLKKAKLGTENTQKTALVKPSEVSTGKENQKWRNSALFAASRLLQKIKGRCTAQTPACVRSIENQSKKQILQNQENVQTVKKNTLASLKSSYIALQCVKLEKIEKTEKTQVYNLSVEGEHNFVANSVVVHNCDCLSMSLARFRQGGFLSLPDDEDDEPRQFKSRRRGYY
jgi:hypothetical protein